MTDSPSLGERITFTHTLTRRSRNSGRPYSYRKAWEPKDAHTATGQDSPVPGIIIGSRTLSNGTCSFSEDGTQYTPDRDGHFTAYLVAYDVRRKPVYVLPEHTTSGDPR